jgi:hypothetical protein
MTFTPPRPSRTGGSRDRAHLEARRCWSPDPLAVSTVTPADYRGETGRVTGGVPAVRLLARSNQQAARIGAMLVQNQRHTFATRHVHTGTKPDVVCQALGHGSLATTSVYVGLVREVMDQELQRSALRSRVQEVQHNPIELVGLLHHGEMPGVRHDHEFRARDQQRHQLRLIEVDGLFRRPIEDQNRRGDRA